MSLLRLALSALAAAVLFFTVEGGEYGTLDLWSQKGRRAQLEAEVAQLKVDVDSLRRELKAFKTDDARLERVAREEWGMVKGGKELLYWVGNGTKPAVYPAAAVVDTSEQRQH